MDGTVIYCGDTMQLSGLSFSLGERIITVLTSKQLSVNLLTLSHLKLSTIYTLRGSYNLCAVIEWKGVTICWGQF